jgi:cytosine/uracil/thiamine/allantoin permease
MCQRDKLDGGFDWPFSWVGLVGSMVSDRCFRSLFEVLTGLRRICVIFGHMIVSFFMVAVGRPGAVYGLGFPTVVRSSFGVFGSFWPIINRDIMTVVWTGVQGVTA